MSRKVEFTKDFDFSPKAHNGHVTLAYKAGQTRTVTDEAYETAFAAGAVTEVAEAGEQKGEVSDDAGGKSAKSRRV